MKERDLLDYLNKTWDQPTPTGSDDIQVYFAYDHTRSSDDSQNNNPERNLLSVLVIERPPRVYDNRLRAAFVNPQTNTVYIAFEGDHGENERISYNYRRVKVVIAQTGNRVITL